MKRIIFLILTFCISISALGQQGISGIVFDSEFDEPLPFANIIVKNQSIGTTTDFDGKYFLELNEGKYEVLYSFVGYETLSITEIVVESNKMVTVDAILTPSSNQLEEVVITTTAKRNTETSVLNIQKKSVNVVDGLSIQAMRKSGDGQMASAIKRVPGLSVQGGKFVYVRGLGDRYTKTMINGMEVPGLDPNKNTVQMDIFPTNLVENVLVNKTKNATLPSDFTGGLVNLKLKDFSAVNALNLSFSMDYNSRMNLNSNFYRDKKTPTDYLARDNGYRDFPYENPDFETPAPLFFLANAEDLTLYTRQLHSHMSPVEDTSFLNYKFNVSYNHSERFSNSTLGFIGSLGYDYNVELLSDYYGATAIMNRENEILSLDNFNSFEGNNSKQNVNINGLFGLSFKSPYAKFSFKYLFINDSDSNSTVYEGNDLINTVYSFSEYGLYYTQKNLRFIPVHFLLTNEDGDLTLEFNYARADVGSHDKDFKTTRFEHVYNFEGEKEYEIAPSSTGYPERLWRGLTEVNETRKVDVLYKFNLFNGYSQKISVGGLVSTKDRDFYSLFYNIAFKGDSRLLNGDPNNILKEDNIWKKDLDSWLYGAYLKGGYDEGDQYLARSKTRAFYSNIDLKPASWFLINAGLRYEEYLTFFSGQDYFGNVYNDQNIIKQENIFPNLNLIFNVKENLKLRGSYYKSSANASFKESSPISFYDPVERLRYSGNLDLNPSFIDNYDLRAEWYGNGNEIISLSFFMKKFKNPIEITAFSGLFPNEFIARNGLDSEVKGVEVEFRKYIVKNDNFLIQFNSNVSVIKADRPYSDEELDEIQTLMPDGIKAENTRSLQGQSPYMINSGLSFTRTDGKYDFGLYYNVQGKTLERVGVGVSPNVFVMPFNDLSFNSNFKFGEDLNRSISFKVSNILNEIYESQYEFYGQSPKRFKFYTPGVEFSLGYSIKF